MQLQVAVSARAIRVQRDNLALQERSAEMSLLALGLMLPAKLMAITKRQTLDVQQEASTDSRQAVRHRVKTGPDYARAYVGIVGCDAFDCDFSSQSRNRRFIGSNFRKMT
jgi:hypothetical protein